MSVIKRFAEEVSDEMGLGGEITDEVMKETNERLANLRLLHLLSKRQDLEQESSQRELSEVRKDLMILLAPELLP